MDLKLNKPKEQEEETRIKNSHMYWFNMNVPRDIRLSIVKHDYFPTFQTNWHDYIKPLIDNTSLLTMYKNNA